MKSCPMYRQLAAAITVALVACGGERPITPPLDSKPGPPDTIVVISGDKQSGTVNQPLAEPLTFQVRDAAGRGVPHVAVVVSDTASANSQTRGTAGTDDRGFASVSGLVLGKRAGDQPLVVVDGSHDTLRVRVTARATAPMTVTGLPFRSLGTNGDVYAGLTLDAFTLAVRDSFENPVPGASVTLAEREGGQIDQSVVTTDAQGLTPPIRWTVATALGSDTLRATAGSAGAVWVANVRSGPPASITPQFISSHVAAGGALSVVYANVRDANGLPVSGAPITWTDVATGAVVCINNSNQGSVGLYSCDWRIPNRAGIDSLRLSSGGVVGYLTTRSFLRPASFRVVGDPTGGGYVLRGTSPADDVVVQVTLPDGSPGEGYLLGGNLDPPVTTDAQGLARYRWNVGNQLGPQQLELYLDDFSDMRVSLRAVVYGSPPLVSLAAGDAHTCGVPFTGYSYAPGLHVVCWGRNAERELADSSTTQRLTPVKAAFDTAGSASRGISARGTTTCAAFIKPAQYTPTHLYCWGGNESGQAGAATRPAWPPTDQTPGANGIAGLARPTLGVTHACAVHQLTNTGHLAWSAYDDGIRCWGDNSFGQLGDGTTVPHLAPASIDTSAKPNLRGVTVGAGDGFTCAVDADGRAWCWGRNNDGQLGDGTTTNRASPVPVSSERRFKADPTSLAVGLTSVCAIGTDGLTYCWGRNDTGELGDGATIPHQMPMPVSSTVRFTSLVAGNHHMCGIASDGRAYCWGSNDRGQIGTGTAGGVVAVPTPVSGGHSFAIIAAGAHHTCAAAPAPDYTAYCWGSNSEGQLGDGTTTDRFTPTPVAAYRPPLAPSASRTNRRR